MYYLLGKLIQIILAKFSCSAAIFACLIDSVLDNHTPRSFLSSCFDVVAQLPGDSWSAVCLPFAVGVVSSQEARVTENKTKQKVAANLPTTRVSLVTLILLLSIVRSISVNRSDTSCAVDH